MKRFFMMLLLLSATLTATAQPQGHGPQSRGDFPQPGPQFEQKDPAQMAQEQTDRLDKLVQLTPKQYKKLYRFHKRQYKRLQNERESFPMERPMGGPGMGGGRPEGMGPVMGSGRPPQGMGPGGQGGPGGRGGEFRRPPMNEDMQELLQEQAEARARKYRRVLSPEQYQKWEAFEAQREFRRMVD